MKKLVMKKMLFLSLLLSPALMAMEPASTNLYCVQKQAALHIINKFNFNIADHSILDVGCQGGDISAKMAETADRVFAIDASKEKIAKAEQRYADISNLNFSCIPPQVPGPENEFTALTSFFCLSRIVNEDKVAVFKNFFRALLPSGWMLCTTATGEENGPVLPVVAKSIKIALGKYPFLQCYEISYLVDFCPMSVENHRKILEECGFANIKIEVSGTKFKFQNKDEYVAWQRPLFMAIPLAKLIREKVSEQALEESFQEFVDLMWDAFEKVGDEGAYYQLSTTVVMAQKPS